MNTDNLSGLQDSLLTDLCRFIDNYTYVVDTEDEYLFIYQYMFIYCYLFRQLPKQLTEEQNKGTLI